MKSGGFSITRALVVVIGLGAVIGVSHLVTPPPPEPPKPPAPLTPAMQRQQAEQRAKIAADQAKQQKIYAQYRASHLDKHGNPIVKGPPPGGEISSVYFRTHAMGEAGIKQSGAETAAAK